MSDRQIVLITDLIESRKRKEDELEYYKEQLKELEIRMAFVQQEIDLTNTIIEIIETEKVQLVNRDD